MVGIQPLEEAPSNPLPYPVENWIRNSGISKAGALSTVKLDQDIRMKMEPGQEDWQEASADQLFTLYPPAFNWSVKLGEGGLMPIVGRDRYGANGAEMQIKLFGLFPVVDVRQNDKLDQGTLQRYLAEIVWFSSAALTSYIEWEPLDSLSARATITHQGTSVSGTFHFNEQGDFKSFETMRFKGSDKDAEKVKWTVTATEYDEYNGIRIPVYLEAEWELETGPWTWLQLRINNIEYNINADDKME